jgi:hypothetical protein
MSKLDDLKQKLKQTRDELEVKLNLGEMEARDEWQKLEKKWDDFQAKAHLEQSAGNVSAALESVGEELHKGYDRLKAALKS